jgi:hypothetical protein
VKRPDNGCSNPKNSAALPQMTSIAALLRTIVGGIAKLYRDHPCA